MTKESRINELTKRQVYYGSSMAVKLNSVNGYFHYSVYAWIDTPNTRKLMELNYDGKPTGKNVSALIDEKHLIIEGKYNGEDPDSLMQEALAEMGIKKLKLGVPFT